MAGLPGTGLGGIFYMFLVIWMGVRETWLSATGMSGRAQWVEFIRLAILTVCIIAALWLEGWLLQQAFLALPTLGLSNSALRALTPAIAAAPLLILAVLLGVIHLVRLLRPRLEVSKVAFEVATKE